MKCEREPRLAVANATLSLSRRYLDLDLLNAISYSLAATQRVLSKRDYLHIASLTAGKILDAISARQSASCVILKETSVGMRTKISLTTSY